MRNTNGTKHNETNWWRQIIGENTGGKVKANKPHQQYDGAKSGTHRERERERERAQIYK